MNYKNLILLTIVLIFLITANTSFAQGPYGDPSYRRMGVHNGNLIATIFFNQGDVSGWSGWGYPPPRVEWPKGSGHEYSDENGVLVAAEVVDIHGNTIHIVSESNLDWDGTDRSPTGSQWGWEPLPGYFNPNQDSPAMSNKPETWPEFWPDKLDSHDDPGWRGLDLETNIDPNPERAEWNGYFGKGVMQADQESYFVMDDHANQEFEFFPDDNDPLRRGLGLQVKSRGLQWSDPLAQDCIFWLYEITNIGTYNYDKIIFGEVFDARIGGAGDENDDLADFISYGDMDITYSWDSDGMGTGGWGPPGYFGFAFLESPGRIDGEDNDDDGLLDERRDSGPGEWIFGDIGIYGDPKWHWSGDEDGDWFSFTDVNSNGTWDRFEPLNDDLGADGLGPEHSSYPGRDMGEGDGLPTDGEPHFDKTDVDESDQIGLTSMDAHIENSVYLKEDELMWRLLQPGHWNPPILMPVNYEFFYGSGFFPLKPGKTERFSLAMLLGEDFDDIIRNKKTVQNIYNANYQFKTPPITPKVTSVAGDKKVTLYWDNRAELSRDPVYGYDFEGYAIYKSTWYDFSDANPITDSYGNQVYLEPVAQFDLANGLIGPHPIGVGSEPGIDQPTGANFNMGNDSGLKHTWTDNDVINGQTYYYAVVSYDKGYDDDFYERGLSSKENLIKASPSLSPIEYELDEQGNILGQGDNTAIVTPEPPATGYQAPTVNNFDHISGPSTGTVYYQILDPLKVKENHTYSVVFDDTSSLKIVYSIYDSAESSDLPIIANISNINNEESPAFDGLMLVVTNDAVSYVDSLSGWITDVSNYELIVKDEKGTGEKLFRAPVEYVIFFASAYIDTSSNNKPAKFEVWDVTYPPEPRKAEFWFKDTNNDGLFAGNIENDFIYILAENSEGISEKSWKVALAEPANIYDTTWVSADSMIIDTTVVEKILPAMGDTLLIHTTKPFRSGDVYQFSTHAAYVQRSLTQSLLDEVAVVPNPYVSAASWETRLGAGIISGRGERKIDFIHLPEKCTIRIFTVRGYLVETIEHNSSIATGDQSLQGVASWNLKTKDGMDIAFGLYIYHIEAPGIGEKVGKFAVIK